MAIGCRYQEVSGHQLAHKTHPLFLTEFLTYAEDRKCEVIVLLGTRSLFAQQKLDQVAGPISLTGAKATGEQFLSRHGGVPGFRRAVTVAAVPTRLGGLFVEIVKEKLTATAGGFTKAQHLLEFSVFSFANLKRRLGG